MAMYHDDEAFTEGGEMKKIRLLMELHLDRMESLTSAVVTLAAICGGGAAFLCYLLVTG